MCRRTSCAHVILVLTPAGGHCLPFFHFAARLVHLGLRVTFLVPEGLVSRFQNDPLFSAHVGEILHEDVEVVAVKDGFSHLGRMEGLIAILRESSEPQLVAAFSEPVSALMSSTKFPPPCCIVSDMLMGWTQELAAKFNIPRFILHTQSAANLSLMLHVPTLIAEGRLPLTASNQEKPVHIPGLTVPLSTSELPSDLHADAFVPSAYQLFLRMSRRAKEAPIVLVNTFRELEDDVFVALEALHANAPTQMPRVIPVGPLLPCAPFSKAPDEAASTNRELDESIMRFMDAQARRSVVYISFGTAGMLNDGELFREVALGLEASGQPFLWVEGPTGFHPAATTLARSLPAGFVERTKERGMVVNACAPQLRILQHPAAGAFLSHCGWNSVLESISAGLPMLTAPHRAEQKMNARFLVDVAKVAAEFKRSNESDRVIPRKEVERVVRLVMQEEAGKLLRSNVERLKESALENAASVETLKTFIALCGGQCNPGTAMS